MSAGRRAAELDAESPLLRDIATGKLLFGLRADDEEDGEAAGERRTPSSVDAVDAPEGARPRCGAARFAYAGGVLPVLDAEVCSCGVEALNGFARWEPRASRLAVGPLSDSGEGPG